MCGIWAYLETTKKGKDLSALAGDFFRMSHRGPDHSHFEVLSKAGLAIGFHRLAIVNPKREGNQPFVKELDDRTIMLMCNGEIYNYKELMKTPLGMDMGMGLGMDLGLGMGMGMGLGVGLGMGMGLGVTSDCQVLLEIYRLLGKKGFIHTLKNQVKGEYAFVLIELDRFGRVSLILTGRDTIGVRPLYIPSSGKDIQEHGLLFTSELKGAMFYAGKMMESPPGHVYEYCFDGLGGLGGLGGLDVTDYDLTTDLYATVSLSSDVANQLTLLSGVRSAVMASVERRLEADRPLAFLTSGGIDSSLVSALSARILGKPIRTFCCGITEEGVAVGRDLEYAREVAEWIGSEHTEVLFTKEEALRVIPDVIRTVESWDTTTIRASVGQYLVCRWIGQNTDCRVVLVGEGPDEVCSSYLFNWYAPSGEALDMSAREYVKNIHLYDGRRADRCIARWGLEARVPFLDPEFIRAYWTIPAEWRMPKTKGAEKWWLREAFAGLGVLPERVRLRMKDAFSDSISGQVSWTEMIQTWITTSGVVTDEEMALASTRFPHATPQTKEAYWYRRIFCDVFGEARQTVLPGYWQPRWNANGVEVSGYVDPSARTLSVYSDLSSSSSSSS